MTSEESFVDVLRLLNIVSKIQFRENKKVRLMYGSSAMQGGKELGAWYLELCVNHISESY